MSLFKNRKRSGMVLTGVVLSSGVVSAVNQGVVGAVPQSEVANGALLGNLADKGAKGLVLECIIAGVLFIILVRVAIKYLVPSKKDKKEQKIDENSNEEKNNNNEIKEKIEEKIEGKNNNDNKIDENNVEINNKNNKNEDNVEINEKIINNNEDNNKIEDENNEINENKKENNVEINNNDNNKAEKEKESNNNDNDNDNDNDFVNNNDINENNKVDGEFETVFCSDEELKDEISEETLKKIEGFIFNTSIEKISKICGYSSALYNRSFFKQHKNDRVNVLICGAYRNGWLKLNLLDEQGKTLVEGIYTKYAVNRKKLDSFCNNLSKDYLKGMPFGGVFCINEMKHYEEEVKTKWKELEKFKNHVYNVSIKEIRAICSRGSVADKLEEILRAYGVDKKEIKIRIRGVCDGYLGLDVLGEENKFLGGLYTKYATTDANKLGNLVNYLSENRVSGETPFSEVFCSGASWDERDTEDTSNWKKLGKFKGKTLNIEIKDLRLIADNVEKLEKEIFDCKLEEKEIKVEISSVMNGYLRLSVFGKNDGDKEPFSFYTKYAVKDNDAIGRLVKYLEDKAEKKENVEGNVDGNNDIKMN